MDHVPIILIKSQFPEAIALLQSVYIIYLLRKNMLMSCAIQLAIAPHMDACNTEKTLNNCFMADII